MPPRSSQHLEVDTELAGARAGESADLQVMSGIRDDSQLVLRPGSSPVSGAKLSNAGTDIVTDCSQSESRGNNGERQQAAVERAESGRRAAASGIGFKSDGHLDQLLSEQQLWDAAWRTFEPHESQSHLSSPDRLPGTLGKDAAQSDMSPSSFPSLTARLFGVGRRSRRREQRCAQSADHGQCHLLMIFFSCMLLCSLQAAGNSARMLVQALGCSLLGA